MPVYFSATGAATPLPGLKDPILMFPPSDFWFPWNLPGFEEGEAALLSHPLSFQGTEQPPPDLPQSALSQIWGALIQTFVELWFNLNRVKLWHVVIADFWIHVSCRCLFYLSSRCYKVIKKNNDEFGTLRTNALNFASCWEAL